MQMLTVRRDEKRRWPAEQTVVKVLIENKLLPETIKLIHFGTHNHVLQSTLGQPAVEEHRDEDIPYGGPEDLRRMRYLAAAGLNVHYFDDLIMHLQMLVNIAFSQLQNG